MRIIGGRYKRRTISAPEGTDVTRPTADRVRENLFNLLQGKFVDGRGLDLFSGSGALGLEALSRGALHVTFVENHPRAVACLRANIASLNVEQNSWKVLPAEVTPVLLQGKKFGLAPASMDFVLADPPYRLEWYAGALNQLEVSGLCAPGCIAVIEMQAKHPPTLLPCEPWQLLDAREYGAARLEIWQRGVSDDPVSGVS